MLIIKLSNIDDYLIDTVANSVKDAFMNVNVLVSPDVMLPPMSFFDWKRMQYRSEYIVKWLASIRERLGADYILGIGDIDAYANGLNFVFGEAYPEGRAAAVYLRRLHPSFYGEPDNHELFVSRAVKEVIHELGHTFGLPHCSNRLCVMSFSNSVYEVDSKTEKFCPRCAERLRLNGLYVSPRYVLSTS
ncbi:peptidase zinc-dependent [Pyrolobus fumarii 1A]|uniref:Archaemetzincin n=1 Tax=Pyrolobus fumarii (strain DSM 11204 / 1A) TaxID=694429 RepID=G0EEE8_PYRF1|nr:peptidase zinc-dependent [Pyrolobus fumarii 1A]